MEKQKTPLFLNKLSTNLEEEGWNKIINQNYPLLLTRQDITTVVTNKTTLAFLQADELSTEEIQQKIDTLHQQTKTQPPIKTATNILILTYQKKPQRLYLPKKQNIVKNKYTVTWMIDLKNKNLRTHKGMPVVKKGEREIKKTLQKI